MSIVQCPFHTVGGDNQKTDYVALHLQLVVRFK